MSVTCSNSQRGSTMSKFRMPGGNPPPKTEPKAK